MSDFGWTDITIAVRVLGDRRDTRERRLAAAAIVGGLRYRDAATALIDAIAEGEKDLAWACSSALNRIKSRKHGRRLIDVLRKTSSVDARQAAIYSIWMLNETRAENVLIQIGDLEGEEEHTRSMAVEALGNTANRRASQVALDKRVRSIDRSLLFRTLRSLRGLHAGCFSGAVVVGKTAGSRAAG